MKVILNCKEHGYLVAKLSPNDKKEALYTISNKLYAEGYVKNTYQDAVWNREEIFPTGLPTEGMSVAIPHTDSEHVLQEGMMLGILENPVKFSVMGGISDETINVEMIFMLAVKNKEDQVGKLQKLIGMFQDLNKLKTLKNGENIEAIKSIMEELK